MGEKWKGVDGHPNYEVSTMGQVRNIRTGNILAPYDDGSGYLRVKLDGENCRASQLEWVTQAENIQHAWDTGLCKRKRRKRV